jgi:predicted hexulose-6-phosphate isomerase
MADTRPYRLGLYEKAMPPALSWSERLSSVLESGFDFLEISIDETDMRLARLDDAAEQGRIRDAVAETGCPIRTLCLSGHRKYPLGSPDPAVRGRALEIMEKALALAAALGIRIIQLAGYDVYYKESTVLTRELFRENLARCAAMAARSGVPLGFETMETPFMDTAAKAMRHVRAVDSPYLQVYRDLGNLTNAAALYGHNVLDDIAAAGGHLLAAHLKETLPGRYREVPFGAGHVDFPAAARAFLQAGVRLFVGEFWFTGSADWREDTRAASRFLRNCLDGAAAKLPALGN